MTTQERNKAELEDFWPIFNGDKMYEDADFSPVDSSLYW